MHFKYKILNLKISIYIYIHVTVLTEPNVRIITIYELTFSMWGKWRRTCHDDWPQNSIWQFWGTVSVVTMNKYEKGYIQRFEGSVQTYMAAICLPKWIQLLIHISLPNLQQKKKHFCINTSSFKNHMPEAYWFPFSYPLFQRHCPSPTRLITVKYVTFSLLNPIFYLLAQRHCPSPTILVTAKYVTKRETSFIWYSYVILRWLLIYKYWNIKKETFLSFW